MGLEHGIMGNRDKPPLLFVATPMYGGLATGLYVKCCFDLLHLAMQNGVPINFEYIFHESLIPRARNYLVDMFLQSEATHCMFIDADIVFQAQDVFNLIAQDKDVIGGCYPKKAINWQNIQSIVRRHRFADPEQLAQLTGDHLYTPLEPPTSLEQPVEVGEIGTGFLMIKREVFERFRMAYPKLSFVADHRETANRRMHAFFDCYIEDGRYLSEDYAFCHRWRDIGGKIYACPWMKLQHVGQYVYRGDIPGIAAELGPQAVTRHTGVTKITT